jgi:TetR/AcrR family transcriptional regulator, cholesterol catabolism regulator
VKAESGPLSRDQILDAAELVFANRGYGESKLNDIAEAFGVTRQALYYYFRSKADILYALYLRWFERARTVLDEVQEAAGPDPADQFDALFSRYVVLHAQNAAMVATFALERDSLPKVQREHVRVLRRQMQQRFVNAYAAATESGEFNAEVPPDTAVALLLGAINWSYRWYQPGRGHSPEELADLAGKIFTSGYRISQPKAGRKRS